MIGGAQLFNIVFSIARTKAIAVLLGPAGVGLAGLFYNLVQTAADLASLGTAKAGSRDIAAGFARDGHAGAWKPRRALFLGTLILALAGGALFFAASDWLAAAVLADPGLADEAAILALAVIVTVLAGYPVALIAGVRRIADLAKAQVIASGVGSVIGVLAVWLYGLVGIVVMTVAIPATQLAVLAWFARRIPREGAALSGAELRVEWGSLVGLGVPLMLSGAAAMLAQLGVRALVQNDLGVNALGLFQAAWALSSTYLGLVLGAMAVDYLPRLTGVINEPERAAQAINEQTEIALVLGGPLILLLVGFAPLVLSLLYSSEFVPAVATLRWQMLGDVFKIIAWPLGFVLIARRVGRTMVIVETALALVLVGGVALLLPVFGLEATGLAYLFVYVVAVAVYHYLARRAIGFRFSPTVVRLALAIGAVCGIVAALGTWSEAAAMAATVIALVAMAVAGFRLLSRSTAGRAFLARFGLARETPGA